MANNLIKIIVKVGKKSNLKFSHSKVFRALTPNDLVALHEHNLDCHIVIIESIDKDEQDEVKKFIKEFNEADTKNKVIFFIPKQDEITSGIADELDLDISLSIKDVYKTIYDTFNINVSTFIDDKKNLSSTEIQDSIPDGITDIFGGLDNQDIEDDIKAEPIEDEVHEEVKNEANEELDKKVKVIEEPEPIIETQVKEENNTSNIDGELEEKYKEQISKLQIELKDCKFDYNTLLNDMKSANSRIASLEDVIKTLEEEKEVMIENYNKIVDSSTILEDPISLSEYEEIKQTLSNSNKKIKELESTISSLKTTLENTKDDLGVKEIELAESKQSYNDIKKQLEDINNTIKSGEIHKDIVAEYEEKLESVNKQIEVSNQKISEYEGELNTLRTEQEEKLGSAVNEKDELVSKLNDTKESLDTANNKIEDLERELKSAITDKEAVTKELKSALDNISKANIAIEKYKSAKKSSDGTIRELEQKLADSNRTVEQQGIRLKSFETDINTANTKVELAESNSKEEINKLKNQLASLTTKLKTTEQQLSQKEAQYTQLLTKTNVEAEGNNVLLDTNKSLESVNKTLREQLGTVTKELNTIKIKDQELQKSVVTYKNQCKQLNNTLKEMAQAGIGTEQAASVLSSLEGAGAHAVVNPITYNGPAQIIPVFGSGSFGVTTMAMSLAYKLGATSKVLYLDFDLVAPKADAWFSTMPLCKNVPGIDVTDRRMTGLGILFEKGIKTFTTYFDSMVNNCEKTKGGGIDYLSGVYYKVDSNKLASTDYTTLFRFLATRYNYIVIDFGRLGSSDINDQLIKAISDISDKNVAVTTSDRFEVRNFRIKLVENKMNINNIAWMINMCEATSLDERVKKTVAPARYGIMLYDQSLQGKRERFTRNKLNKDKLDLFINSILFGKR